MNAAVPLVEPTIVKASDVDPGLLRAAGIDGPFVLVAASYGGRVARLYTSQHPEQVLGLVMVGLGLVLRRVSSGAARA